MGRKFEDESGKRYGHLTVIRFERFQNSHACFRCRCRWCGREVIVRGAHLRSGRQTTCGQPHQQKFQSADKRSEMWKIGQESHHNVWGPNRGEEVVVRHEDTNEIVATVAKSNPRAPVKWMTQCKYCDKRAEYTERRIRSGLICECLRLTWRCWYEMVRRCTQPTAPKWNAYGGAGVVVDENWKKVKKGFFNFLSYAGKRPSLEHQIGRIGDRGDYVPGNCKWMTREEQAAEQRKKRKIRIYGR